jgi:hypothetical protein
VAQPRPRYQGVCSSPLRSEDVGGVLPSAAGADVASEDVLVLVAGGGGDLGGVVAVAGGLGGVPGAQRVSGELAGVKPGGAGAFFDDQRDGLGGEGGGDGAGASDAAEDRAGADLAASSQARSARTGQERGGWAARCSKPMRSRPSPCIDSSRSRPMHVLSDQLGGALPRHIEADLAAVQLVQFSQPVLSEISRLEVETGGD